MSKEHDVHWNQCEEDNELRNFAEANNYSLLSDAAHTDASSNATATEPPPYGNGTNSHPANLNDEATAGASNTNGTSAAGNLNDEYTASAAAVAGSINNAAAGTTAGTGAASNFNGAAPLSTTSTAAINTNYAAASDTKESAAANSNGAAAAAGINGAKVNGDSEAAAVSSGPAVLSSEEIQRLIYKVKSHHDEAYLYLDQALQCDETRQTEQAMTLYNKAVRCIQLSLAAHDQLLVAYFSNQSAVRKELLRRSASVSDDIDELVNKMQRTIGQIHHRVEELLLLQDAVVEVPPKSEEDPPSYESATSSIASSPSSPVSGPGAPANATRLFYVEDGVQMYYIASDGSVSAPSYPTSLALYRFNNVPEQQQQQQQPVGFLQVGEWVYPLLPGTSPVLHAASGAYMFPNVNSPLEGSSVGVMIPDCVDVSDKAQFDKLLRSLTDMRQQTQRTSQQIARGISVAADWITWGLTKGAEKTRGLMEQGSSRLKERIEPNKDKSQIDHRAQRTAQYAQRASKTAVRVSSYLVTKLGDATSALGRTLAPHIRRHSEHYLPASLTHTDSLSGRSTLDNVSEVAASSLQGFSTVYLALENAAVTLAQSLANSTVEIVQHKFGEEAGEFTGDVVYSAGNVAVATHNVGNLGVKAIAKRVAKDTGRALVHDESFHRPDEAQPSNRDHSNSSYNNYNHSNSDPSNGYHSNNSSDNRGEENNLGNGSGKQRL